MFSWPLPELTEYERQFVRLYKTPKLNAQGKETGEYWPGVLTRRYQALLYSQNVPGISFLTQGPVFEDRVIISRRSRIFALTFSGDVYSWLLNIQTASGERYTNQPCLVSSMCGGTTYNENGAFVGPPFAIPGDSAAGVARQNANSFGVLIDPNWLLVPNETLFFEGTLAAGVPNPEQALRILSIGVHVWEFPGMSYSTKEEREAG